MLTSTYDQGWDDEIVGGLSKGYKALKSNLINDGLIAHYKGNTYVYLAAMNKWGVLISAEAQRQVCDITGSENATVSYLGASLPYISFMEKHAVRAGSIPVSVCIGTRRLSISKKDDTITFTECENVVSVNSAFDDRVGQFCVMPCSFNKFPNQWSPGGPQKLYRYLRVLFTDPIEFETILWIIGMIAVDPSSSSKFLLLIGEGGTGKSTLISTIEDVFTGCCGTIASSILTAKNYNIPLETGRTIASNRVVTAGDLNLENTQMNLHAVKEITGHDSISIPPIKVRTRCSLVGASNGLPHPVTQKEWCSLAISRRTAVVPMNVKTSMIPKLERPDGVDHLMDMLGMGINVYLNNMSSMPMSMRSLLLTIIGSGYIEIEEKIEYDETATQQEIFDANTGIDLHFGLPLHTIGELAFSVSPDWVIIHSTIPFINNIKLIEELPKQE